MRRAAVDVQHLVASKPLVVRNNVRGIGKDQNISGIWAFVFIICKDIIEPSKMLARHLDSFFPDLQGPGSFL